MIDAIAWQLPGWLAPFVAARSAHFKTMDEKMALAAALALENVRQETGGPFGAAVFDVETDSLVSVGVNLVTRVNASIAHAEMVALSLAQARLTTFDLGSVGRFELVTSVEPCAMCLGAIPWSGVVSVVSGATAEDAEAIGFDEGAKPQPWAEVLRQRGIEVYTEVDRAAGVRALQAYATGGGEIYNGDQGR